MDADPPRRMVRGRVIRVKLEYGLTAIRLSGTRSRHCSRAEERN